MAGARSVTGSRVAPYSRALIWEWNERDGESRTIISRPLLIGGYRGAVFGRRTQARGRERGHEKHKTKNRYIYIYIALDSRHSRPAVLSKVSSHLRVGPSAPSRDPSPRVWCRHCHIRQSSHAGVLHLPRRNIDYNVRHPARHIQTTGGVIFSSSSQGVRVKTPQKKQRTVHLSVRTARTLIQYQIQHNQELST